MKFCYLLSISFLLFLLPTGLVAQNLFSEKIDVCNTAKYCMDCGTPQATCSPFTLDYISYMINHRYNFKNGFGSISFQVLVDSTGFSCVLSHNDVTHSQLTNDLIRFLNGCIWKPAMVHGKPQDASVNVIFTIAYGHISGQMQRIDLDELVSPGSPTVYNTGFHYVNPSINNYNFKVYTKYNSPLPDNQSEACIVDKHDILWYGTAHGLTRFDGKVFNDINEGNSPLTAKTPIKAIAVDKDNNKWIYANRSIYMVNDSGWRMFDSTHVGIAAGYRIVTNPSREIFFTNSKGLLILRDGKVRLIDKQVVFQLPSNDVYYAYYDSHERLWIGTAKGSIMIDKKQKVTSFNGSKNPLDNVCISNITEDEHGNLYFSLLSTKKQPPGNDDDDEGIAVMTDDGQWSHYNDKNSGLPANHVNSILYDRFEHVLWIGTRDAGLVRFNLKTGWENYNSTNTSIPGFDIFEMAEDSHGIVYASTANGMLMITRKQLN